MFLEQLSVFLENRVSRLNEILLVLKNNNINVLSLTLADTNDYGIIRLIVDRPEDGKKALTENGYSARLTRVLAVKVPNRVGTLQEILSLLCNAGINLEYMYVLANGRDFSAIVVRTDDSDKTGQLLADNGFTFVTAEEVPNIGA